MSTAAARRVPPPVPLAADGEPCPQLTQNIRADMADAALDVLLCNDGVCEAHHLVEYGFCAELIVTHSTAALRTARANYAAQRGVPKK